MGERQMQWVEVNGRLVRPGGVSEIATDLEVIRSRVTNWITRKKIGANGQPPPEVIIPRADMGPTFALDDWREWFGLEPETPPKQ